MGAIKRLCAYFKGIGCHDRSVQFALQESEVCITINQSVNFVTCWESIRCEMSPLSWSDTEPDLCCMQNSMWAIQFSVFSNVVHCGNASEGN